MSIKDIVTHRTYGYLLYLNGITVFRGCIVPTKELISFKRKLGKLHKSLVAEIATLFVGYCRIKILSSNVYTAVAGSYIISNGIAPQKGNDLLRNDNLVTYRTV